MNSLQCIGAVYSAGTNFPAVNSIRLKPDRQKRKAMGFVPLTPKIPIWIALIGLCVCGSVPASAAETNNTGGTVLTPTNRPIVFRSYLRHQNIKRLHVISVGDPRGIHYAVDIQQGSLLQVWQGGFLDPTPIWTDRGMEPDSRLLDEPEPLGNVLELTGDSPLALLSHASQSWPAALRENQIEFKGYRLDARGRPTFHYRLGDLVVYDRLRPSHEQRALTRQWTFKGELGTKKLWCLLAAETKITQLAPDRFSINDGRYIISLPKVVADDFRLRKSGDRRELLVPVPLDSPASETTISYTLVW